MRGARRLDRSDSLIVALQVTPGNAIAAYSLASKKRNDDSLVRFHCVCNYSYSLGVRRGR